MGRAVPYATDPQGQVISPVEAAPGGTYSCLECREPVSFRRAHTRLGRDVEAHFAHRPGNECRGESVLHLAAKFRLREALQHQERPFLIRQVCTRWHCAEAVDIPLSLPAFDTAAEEVTLFISSSPSRSWLPPGHPFPYGNGPTNAQLAQAHFHL